jgi:multiple sugar transport system substrate-binding protein
VNMISGSRRQYGKRVAHAMRALAAGGLSLTITLVSSACGERDNPNEVRFWALGREGEVVKEMVRDFEKEHPGITVRVQQIPWSAAHEKLLTAHVGDVTPDVAQIGNTWVPEFVALHALEPLSPHIAMSKTVDAKSYFSGIWETNVLADTVWGVPWYVDTRLMYYRKDLLEKVGWKSPPTTWAEWRLAMEKIRSTATRGPAGEQNWGAFIPTNEWNLPIILGLQSGSTLLREDDGRGAFKDPDFHRAFEYFVALYRDGLAPKYGSNDVANLYQEFAKGRFVFYVSGPWQIGEFRNRLPVSMKGLWGTAPMPGPKAGVPGVSLAGGASLVVFKKSRQKTAAWQLVEYLSRPEQQVRFYELTGDLPARTEAWKTPRLANDTLSQAFYTQLLHVLPTPKVPEWELIAQRVIDHAETVVRGNTSVDDALQALDKDVDNILEKRRWLQSRKAATISGQPNGAATPPADVPKVKP